MFVLNEALLVKLLPEAENIFRKTEAEHESNLPQFFDDFLYLIGT